MDTHRNKTITPEREEYLVNKWKFLLDFNNTTPLSGQKTRAILIEGQEKWFTPEQVRSATPNLKHEDQ